MGEVVVQAADGRELQVRRKRKDGWSGGKRASFLDHLAATANVEAACRAVGMNSSGVFKLRRRNPDFAEQWDAALDTAKARLRAMLSSGRWACRPRPRSTRRRRCRPRRSLPIRGRWIRHWR